MTTKRLQVQVDNPAAEARARAIGFDDPMEAHRYADRRAAELPTNATVTIYDNEARDFCGHYLGRDEPADETPAAVMLIA